MVLHGVPMPLTVTYIHKYIVIVLFTKESYKIIAMYM